MLHRDASPGERYVDRRIACVGDRGDDHRVKRGGRDESVVAAAAVLAILVTAGCAGDDSASPSVNRTTGAETTMAESTEASESVETEPGTAAATTAEPTSASSS